MNIIGNECTSGYIYKFLGKQFNNPFMWVNTLDDDFVTLMNNYETINFNNYQFILLPEGQHPWKGIFPQGSSLSVLNVDDKIRIYHTHHLYSDQYGKELTLLPSRRYISSNIEETVIDNYKRRVERMAETNEKPIFLWHEWGTYDGIDKLLEAGRDCKKIIITRQLKTEVNDDCEIYNFNDISYGATDIGQEHAAKWLLEHSKIIQDIKKTT